MTISFNDQQNQCPEFLDDLKQLHDNYGLGESFTMHTSFVTFDGYPNLIPYTI